MEEILPGYIRVSAILKPLTNFDGANPLNVNRKATMGTEVHEAINLAVQGLHYPLQKELRGYFESYAKWLALSDYKIVQSEKRYYDHSLKITGCPDAIVESQSGKKYLVDWKTTSSQNRPYWQHQGVFYHHLATLSGLDLEPRIFFVQLCEMGGLPNVFIINRTESIMQECLNLYKIYLNKNNLVHKSP